ncbi:S-adenosyl-L-methionine-dependent methyltransferase [Polychytrium aggregatum]|uniref:S-adenosyl-L-methionine-dependent methyltransferase n=1 Tax=Polychytrium aggregatum TaxID=110093 RepID=UPI0022FEE03F|nr:S-adenosyl-L-methionine-dependent methyltransferase [Polychytrium aggregatum]KAI9204092.1 S-adenosyl-L-methionine-dependent methyltransferase [Polychytrium aggregatum]
MARCIDLASSTTQLGATLHDDDDADPRCLPQRNTVKFFKDRHWTEREFPELQSTGEKKVSGPASTNGKVDCRINWRCGVGNFVFPVLEANPDMFIYCCDFSSRAIEFVKANENYDESRCLAFVCDITQDPLTNTIPAASLDLLSSIFCLSAVPPQKLQDAVNNIGAVMKPGGLVMFRDYGLYDAAQLRFKPGHKIDDNFYVRQDGTFSVYFSIEQLKELFENAGFEAIAIDYVEKEIVNRKRELSMQRRWIQAKFRKL